MSMKKNEALNFIRTRKGYVPYIGFFGIWNDDDEIPENVIELSIKEDRPVGREVMGSAKFIEQIERVINGH